MIKDVENVGVERFLFVIDMKNTDSSSKLQTGTYDSWVAMKNSSNSIAMAYSDKYAKTYQTKCIDDITLESKRQLDLLQPEDKKDDTYFYSKNTELKIGFDLYDWFEDTGYNFANDEENNPYHYLDIIGKIIKVDSATGVESTVPMASGTKIKYLNNLSSSEEEPYTWLQSSDSIFFFNGQGKTYDMNPSAKDGHKPATSRNDGKQSYGIVLNFADSAGFSIDSNCDYYFVLELKRSLDAEYSDSISAIKTIQIPLTTIGTGAEYGYRMTVDQTNQLSVNLNSDNIENIVVKNEFSGVKPSDDSNVSLEYELYYKQNDSYNIWKKVANYGDIRLLGLTDGNKNTSLLMNNGKAELYPWYLYMNSADSAETKGAYTITQTGDAYNVKANNPQSGVTCEATVTSSGTLSAVSATVNGTTYSAGQQIDGDMKQLVDYLNYVKANKVTTGYKEGTIGDNEKAARAQLTQILRIMKSASVNATGEKDANDNTVYSYNSSLVFAQTEGTAYNLPFGNYKLIGKLTIDGTEVASDYIIFNVNRLSTFDVIQDSNLWYRNPKTGTDNSESNGSESSN